MGLSVKKGNTILHIPDEERQLTEVFSRVMGYYRPMSEWNIGKHQEGIERAMYDQVYPAGMIHQSRVQSREKVA